MIREIDYTNNKYIEIITCYKEPDIVFIHEFLIPYRERASEWYGIKNM